MSHSDWQNSSPLVVDTNTVLSGLIGGVTRRLLFELDRRLCYPESSLDEIRRDCDFIYTDADSARQFAERDAGDVVFLATALAVDGDIWSDDSVFQHQDYADWYRTEDVVDYADIDTSGTQ